QATSMWMLGYVNSDPQRLIRSDEVLPRLMRWLSFARTLFGTPTPIFALVIPLSVFARVVRAPRQCSTVIDITLLTFVLVYWLLHWLVAFNTYDRYLLPLLPPLASLAARGSMWLWRVLSRYIMSAELIGRAHV